MDNPTDPRTGTVESLSMQFGGLGGTNSFIKGVAHFRYFYPFLKSQTLGTFVVSQGITFGIGTNLESGTGGELPLYERFFPGGVGGPGDVRGYQLYSLGPQVTIFSQNGTPQSVQDIGGSKELLLSNEITFPILSGLGNSRRDIQRRGAIVPAQGFARHHQAAGVGGNRRALEIAIRAAGGGYRFSDQPAAGRSEHRVRSRRRLAAVASRMVAILEQPMTSRPHATGFNAR